MLDSIAVDQPKIASIKNISILSLICLIVEIYFIGNKFGAGVVGGITGQCMVYSIIAFFIFPYRWLKASSLAFIIPIALCFTIVGSYEVYKLETVENKLKQDGRQVLIAFKALNDGNTFTNDQIEALNLGVFHDLVKSTNDVAIKIPQVFFTYTQFVDNQNLNTAFDAEILSDRRQRSLCKLKLNEIQGRMVATKNEIDSLISAYELSVEKSDMPSEMRSSFKSGFKEGVNHMRGFYNEYFELESLSLQTMLDIYRFLDTYDGRYSLVNGKLLFNNDDEREQLANLYNSLGEISARAEALQKVFKDEQDEKYKSLETMIK